MRVREQSKRTFGRDITNLERRSKNSSIYEKVNPKNEHRYRSKSVVNKKEKQERVEAIDQYKDDILRFMASAQRVEEGDSQGQISEKMRQILIDWLVDVHESFELKEQTLYLALAYLNLYCSKGQVTKDDYQLIGVTCLWIASKYEEIYPPRMSNFVEVTANTYKVEDLKKMEGQIIITLEFNLNYITSLQLLEATPKLTPTAISLSKYILELALLEGLGKKYNPSVMVLAAVSLTDFVYEVRTDISMLKDAAKVTKEDLAPCFKDMCTMIQNGNKFHLKALKRKFLKDKYHAVSKIRLESR